MHSFISESKREGKKHNDKSMARTEERQDCSSTAESKMAHATVVNTLSRDREKNSQKHNLAKSLCLCIKNCWCVNVCLFFNSGNQNRAEQKPSWFVNRGFCA